MEESFRKAGVSRWREPLPVRLIEALPGVDIRMVADRTKRRRADGERAEEPLA